MQYILENLDILKHLNLKLECNLTESATKIVSTFCKYLDIPYKTIYRIGKSGSKLLDLVDKDLEKKISKKTLLNTLQDKQEQNLSQITLKAIEIGNQNTSKPSEKEVSEDWLNLFFENAKTISLKELQNIWAAILAREINQPNSISTRIFETLKHLDTKTAKSFGKLSLYSSNDLEKKFVIIDEAPNNELRNLYRLTYQNRLNLVEAGLIHDNNSSIAIKTGGKDKRKTIFEYGQYEIFIETKPRKDSNCTTYYSILPFTRAGTEIARSIPHSNDIQILPKMFRMTKNSDYKMFFRKKGSKELYQIIPEDKIS